ncbi:HNH endonuclease signature motif containing protein [Providencia stuartii]|uniref:HNH nuclease domain-containing protein n=1 Tax=Providencia stuartii (strain MRSN 2154) TaxID=1157951 RepID=A0A140SSY3_PROSM|nr:MULTISPECIES: HNH endonuclease signature motif containing protein [Providencia]AFH95537.1 hypothetical protein S70_18680 [Providencia stuartii MRSN 2154]MDE8745162.1 HNH endonuclease signature motif containing protein [Providencia thailandensis]MDE8764607.1 HNH endonuclease signature motif containing protein [Providencia thailandensis]MDE8777110.1 HNH endonuclease signature motif containing protein [Providencia thailandensis]MDE8781099.1 HNH endonuclease signature motif containing protein [
MTRVRFVYTKEMHDFMRKNYLLPIGELTKAFNEQFSTTRSTVDINGLRQRLKLRTGRSGNFKKGCIPFNKNKKGLISANSGSFKKGNKPYNYQPVGAETLTTDGYVKVKIAEPNKWELKHRLVWEKYNGKLEKGFIIKFIDDDKQNCDINNLMIISTKEHAVINRHLSGATHEHKQTVLQLARIKMAIRSRETKRQDQC